MEAKTKCRICKVILTKNNQYKSNMERNYKICNSCCVEKSKIWAKNNKDKVSKSNKSKYKRNKNYYSDYRKKYYIRNKNIISEMGKKYRVKNQKHIKNRVKNIYNIYNKKINNIFGIKCFICYRKGYLFLHEKKGKKHSHSKAFLIKNKIRFVRLCSDCHKGTHFCMEKLNMNWEKIIKIRGNL